MEAEQSWDDGVAMMSAVTGKTADEIMEAFRKLAGWNKPPTSQFEEVMGATEEEVARAHMVPDTPLRTKAEMLRRLQLQYRYRNAHWNGSLKTHL